MPKQYIDLSLGCLQRHLRLVAYCALSCMLAGLLFHILRPNAYTTHSRLLLDRRELHVATPDAIYSTSTVSVPWVQTQVELLRAETIALPVVQRLNLDTDPDFVGRSWTERLGSLLFNTVAVDTPEDRTKKTSAAVRALQRDLLVARVGDTYLIDIWVTAKDPAKSTLINTEIANAYFEESTKATSALAEGASPWLRERVIAGGPSARVVTPSSVPLGRNPPGGLALLLLSGLAGVLLGAGAAVAKDFFDPTARTPEGLSAALGTECFGITDAGPQTKANASTGAAATPFAGSNDPLSVNRQTAERATAALLFERKIRSVGISSTDRLSGSRAAWQLASVVAATGRRVLVLGGAPAPDDLAGPIPNPAKLPKIGTPGGDKPKTGGSIDQHPLSESELTAATFGTLVLEHYIGAETRYDFVIVQLPGLAPTAAVRLAAHHLDGILLVVQWGHSDTSGLVALLDQQPVVRDKLVGAILSDVDMNLFPTYTDASHWARADSPNLRTQLQTLAAADLATCTQAYRQLAAKFRKQ